MLSASVIGLFDASIEKMIALAVLMPIVASMGGNAGTQTVTVVVRALAVRELTPARCSMIFSPASSHISIRWVQRVRLVFGRVRYRGCDCGRDHTDLT